MNGPFLRKKPHNICANIAILYFECLRGTTITPLKLYMTKSFFQEKKLVYKKTRFAWYVCRLILILLFSDLKDMYLHEGLLNLVIFRCMTFLNQTLMFFWRYCIRTTFLMAFVDNFNYLSKYLLSLFFFSRSWVLLKVSLMY